MRNMFNAVFWAILWVQGVTMAADLHTLEINGTKIPVIFEKVARPPIASLQLVFTNAGHLSNDKDGQADMSAKLLNEGTKKDGAVGFAQKLDDHAVDLHASVGRETFVIELSTLAEEFGYGAQRLAELLGDPNYTDEAFAQVKRQKMGWLMQKQSDFDYIAATHLRKLLFGDTPLGRPYQGTIESVEAMTLEDLRGFIQRRLGKTNLIVVAGGAITLDDVTRALEPVVALLPEVKTRALGPWRASDAQKTEYIPNNDTQQAYIYFGAPFAYSYKEPDQYKAKIAEYVLGGAGFGSRLMEELRVKRGLTYGAYSVLRRAKYASYLSGYLQTKLASQDEAIATVKEVVRDFVAKGITQEELDAAKKFLVGSEPLRLETLSQRLNRAFDEYYYGRPLGFTKQQLEQIRHATLEEINAFITRHPELAELSFSVVTKKIKSKK